MIIIIIAVIFVLLIICLIICLGKEKLEFSGWKEEEEEEEVTKRFSKANDELHFVVYGKTGSGKTHFVKEYTSFNTSNIVVFCKDEKDCKD